MLGVFKRRWKPKRVPSDAIRPAGIGVGVEGRCVSPVGAQVHPVPVEPNQLHAYEPTSKRKQQLQQQQQQLQNQQPPVHHTHSNICVQAGRIEFVKQLQDGSTALTPDHEKYDGDKEALEDRIKQLEQRLEAEASNAQRDRLAVARLQHQLSKREEGACRDVEVARDELHARLARAEHEAERANARLRAAHRELSRMEETVRSLLQYKSCVETLKQEKSSLSAVLEARSVHYQASLQKLSSENEALKAQVNALQAAILQNSTPSAPTPQYERCLDEVASQVVRALLTQKGLLDEVGRLNARARDLEAQNRTLGTLLLRQLKPKATPSPATPTTPAVVHMNHSCSSSPITSNSQRDKELLSAFETFHTTAPHSLTSKNKPSDVSVKKRLHKNNRISKSNNDISSSACAGISENNCNKRRSDGDLKLPSSTTNSYSEHSIISFKDESFSDMMSVCVSHHTYQLSAEDKRRHQILTDLWTELKSIEVTPQSLIEALQSVDPSLWAPPERPLTLNLKKTTPVMLSQYLQRLSQAIPDQLEHVLLEDETVLESPESGNRDEGYSTMSSDVQIDPLRQGSETTNRELEDLKEASDETENQMLLSINNTINVEDKTESDILYIPLNIAFNLNQRNSFPPSKNIFPFQHIIRSFSDSHLCLRLTTSQYIENCLTLSSAISNTPSIQNMKVLSKDRRKKLLKRTNGTCNLLPASKYSFDKPFDQISQNRNSWTSNIDDQVDGCECDAEYVQHWLKLDDTRSSLQQQHRDLVEYDQAELEDWSLNLSCEELDDDNWKKMSFNDVVTPGQLSISTLPSIQENNALELEEDVSECLWNNSSYMIENTNGNYTSMLGENDEDSLKRSNNWPYSAIGNTDLLSPAGSWSSIENSEDCSECFYNKHLSTENDTSKRSSGCGEEPESSSIGIDFTRDFYRLVKFESTKSLASNSSKCLLNNTVDNPSSAVKSVDTQTHSKHGREQVLQNVINYIAEQQKYCFTREELDSLPPSRPISEIHELPVPFADSDFQNMRPKNSVKSIHDLNSTQNEIVSSENDLCDIVIRNELSLLCNASSDLETNTNTVCEHKPNLTNKLCDNVFYDFSNIENDADKLHMLKVSQKNEMNKVSDIDNCGNSRESRKTEPIKKMYCCIKASNDTGYMCNLTNVENAIKTCDVQHVGNQKDACYDRKKKIVSNSKPSLFENVLKLSLKENEPLITVVEEEESCLENFTNQMSDSMTTSVSTIDTVATEIRTDKRKYDKSKIPVPIQSNSKKNMQTTKKPIITANDMETASTTETIIITDGSSPSKSVSFHESATSKDVIEQLNRMIRKGEENSGNNEVLNETPCVFHTSDKALWKPSGWVHVEKEIDFNDPKARANLLDVMLASSDSSPSSTSSCAGSFSSESSDDKADYSKLHQLHRYRRQKKAAALRERGLAVLRFSYFHRPSIIGRDNLFVRYGKQEQDAVSCFDFLEEISRENEYFESSNEETASKELITQNLNGKFNK